MEPRRRRLDGEQDRERRPLPRSAGDRDAAAVRFDVPLDDRQPQAGAAVLAARALIGLVEAVEDPLLQLRGDADAGVLDGDLDEPGAAERTRACRRDIGGPGA